MGRSSAADVRSDVSSIDTTIRVDRLILPAYLGRTDLSHREIEDVGPSTYDTMCHPELQEMGPAEYDLLQVELWLHPDQKDGGTVGSHVIYQYLKEHDLIKTCLGVRDGEEIQGKGIAVFEKFFGRPDPGHHSFSDIKAVFL